MLLRYSLQESSTDWVPDPRRRKDGIHPKMYVGCSQNYGPLDLQTMLRHPIFGVPKMGPKFGNYPCLIILVSGAVSLLQKEGAGLIDVSSCSCKRPFTKAGSFHGPMVVLPLLPLENLSLNPQP